MSDRRVWIGCLASYNAGELYGEWVESAGLSLEELQEAVDRILAASPEPGAEEYFIADHEGYEGLLKGEPSLAEVADAEEAIGALDDEGDLEAFAAYIINGYTAANVADAVEDFQEALCGYWRSEREFAEHLLNDLGAVDQNSLAARYFDYDAFARDLFMSDYWSAPMSTGEIAVFHNV